MFGFGRAMPGAAVPLWPLKRKIGDHSDPSKKRGYSGHARVSKPPPEAARASSSNISLTAFPPLRKLAPGRKQLSRGSGKPLNNLELQSALDYVRQDVHAASTIGPQGVGDRRRC